MAQVIATSSVATPALAGNMKDQKRMAIEQARRREIRQSRLFYAGEQYEERNRERAKAMNCESWELPEHEKLHAYSTQIQESVDFIASQMTDSFQLKVASKVIQDLLIKSLQRSPDLHGGAGEDDISLTNVVREALIAQDTPVHVRWDPVELIAWPEFWDSELVEYVYDDRDSYKLVKVLTSQTVWATDFGGNEVEKEEITEWEIFGVECVKRVYFRGEEDLADVTSLGIPFIPWVSLRATRKQSRSNRGESMITKQAVAHASRYNALEQTGYLIARYNSHGNLAVIGDSATLKAQMDQRINKDVADILTFPGGTALQVLQLPTDPEMIIHQRGVLLDAMYGVFGLARVDTETLSGLGQVSGYALEILNRKSEGTFQQIRNQYVGDFRRMLDMILDMTAYKQSEEIELAGFIDATVPDEMIDMAALEEAVIERMMEIDPQGVFPKADRQYKMVLGSGYVVDRAMLRSDYDSGLISQQEYLRQANYSDTEIKAIMKEQEEAKPVEPEAGLSAEAIAGASLAIDAAKVQPDVTPVPTDKATTV